MIHNDADYRKAMSVIDEERNRIDGHVMLWKKQSMTGDEIKRLRNPMMCHHLQFVEEAEAWRMENYGPEISVKECADGFAIAEPQSGDDPCFLYYGSSATASRMNLLSSDELFPTREAAEERMLEMFPAAEGGCMGPVRPTQDIINETVAAVMAIFHDRGLLAQDEESMCKPMAENRIRVLRVLKESVEQVLFQDACENF